MAQPISMDKERVSFNLARYKKGGENFEIVIDPDLAIASKNKKNIDIREILKSEKIFSDAKKGLLASETHMKAIFDNTDNMEVAKIILKEGEIQLTQEYRNRLYEEKKKRIVEIIHRNGIDPTSGLPHPKIRIENAFSEAKIKIDYYKSAEDLVHNILKDIRKVLPIRFETKEIEIKIPAQYAAKMYSLVTSYGKILKDVWANDGAWIVNIELPAGLQNEFFDKLNSATHGDVSIKVIE